MARTEKVLPSGIEAVFAVLCDPTAYASFVVGSKRVRGFDPHWPEPGTTLHHAVGIGPLALRDRTDALGWQPPEYLLLRPSIRPFVVTDTHFRLRPHEHGTLVQIDEYAVEGPLAPIWPGPLDWAMGLRNKLVLRRLARLASQRD